VPKFENAEPKTDPSGDVSVPNGSTSMTLSPGKYRDVTLEPHSTLTLTGGIYHIRNLWAKTNSKLLFAAASSVRISNGLGADNSSVIGPTASSSVTAANIIFYVGGTDQVSRFSLAVTISPKSSVSANIYAKNGTLLLNQQTQATGAFLGKDIVLGQNVQVSLMPAFTGMVPLFGPSVPKIAPPDPGTSPSNEIPTTFHLAQNYPNPFNPSTQIRYGLPRQTHVNLTIHNLLGQEVARLVDELQESGYHEVRWNGNNATGTAVGTGVYIYRIQAGDFVETRKMIFLK
jgi:hypothetical protein